MENDLYHKNKKFKSLIDTGRAMIFKYGLKRITTEEICEKADVSKVTFYKFFRNKEDLVMAILKIWTDRIYKEYHELVAIKGSFREKIEASIKYKIDISQEYSNEFLEELLIKNKAIYESFEDQRRKFTQLDLRLFRQGQKEGVISNDITPEFIMYLTDYAKIMFMDEKLKSIMPDMQERIKQVMNFFYFGLAGRDRKNKTKPK